MNGLHTGEVVQAPRSRTRGGVEADPLTTICVVPKVVATSRSSHGTGQLRMIASYLPINCARASGLRKAPDSPCAEGSRQPRGGVRGGAVRRAPVASNAAARRSSATSS